MTTHTKASRERCLERLRELASSDDPEVAHWQADLALVELIDDAEVEEAWKAITRWYA